MKLLCLLPTLLFIFLSNLTGAPLNGWKKVVDAGAVIYRPADLPKGRTFEYRFYGPISLESEHFERWFRETTMAMQNNLWVPQEDWDVKPDGKKWSVTASLEQKSGKTMSSAFESGRLGSGQVYLMHLRSDVGVFNVLRYGLAYEKLLPNVLKELEQNPTIGSKAFASKIAQIEKTKPGGGFQNSAEEPEATAELTPKEKRRQIELAIRVPSGEGVKPEEIETIWVHSRLDLIWGGMALDTYLLLKDGSVYTDCKIPPSELDVETSKKLESKKWSVWRENQGEYWIKDPKTGEWEDIPGTQAGVLTKGTNLSGVYFNAGGSQFSGSWKKKITFSDQGRFEMSSSALRSNGNMGGGNTAPLVTIASNSDSTGTSTSSSVIGGTIGGGSSRQKNDGAKNTGSYEIHGSSITLKHDNGWVHTELLLFEDNDNKSAIVFGDDLYFPSDE